jgi:hypothetical protein
LSRSVKLTKSLPRDQCDGARPVCIRCSSKDRVCVYTTAASETRGAALKRKHGELEQEVTRLRSANSSFNELLGLIRSRDSHDAAAIFHRLRAGADPEAIVRSVRDGDSLLQLYVAPETSFRYSFPLRRQMPLSLRIHTDVYLSTLRAEPAAVVNGSQENENAPKQRARNGQGAAPGHRLWQQWSIIPRKNQLGDLVKEFAGLIIDAQPSAESRNFCQETTVKGKGRWKNRNIIIVSNQGWSVPMICIPSGGAALASWNLDDYGLHVVS